MNRIGQADQCFRQGRRFGQVWRSRWPGWARRPGLNIRSRRAKWPGWPRGPRQSRWPGRLRWARWLGRLRWAQRRRWRGRARRQERTWRARHQSVCLGGRAHLGLQARPACPDGLARPCRRTYPSLRARPGLWARRACLGIQTWLDHSTWYFILA